MLLFRVSVICFLLGFATCVYAWTKEDYEIFDIVSELEQAEGKGTTFYSFLDVPSHASTAEIAKSYRRKSVRLHPDKNPGVKGAHEKYARLGLISSILRNPEGRKRYDFFHKNGVPRWRGTGYYYSRFRPGLGTVLCFLVILTSGLQYWIQRLNYAKDISRIDRIVSEARMAAWGPRAKMSADGTATPPREGRRKVKVNVGGRPYIDEDGEVVQGRYLDMLVESDNQVYIIESDGETTLLDRNAAGPHPALSHTWSFVLLRSLYYRFFPKKQEDAQVWHDDDDHSIDHSDAAESNSDSARNGDTSGAKLQSQQVATKPGGRRRKTSRRK